MPAHTSWGLYNNKSLSHSGTTPLSVHPATSVATSSSFNFPPTPPKDGTPDNVNNTANTNTTNSAASSDYSSEKSVTKQEDPDAAGLSPFMPPSSGHTAHPVPTYPSYTDYSGSLGFHHPSMFKTSPTLSSRPRQKSRSSAGNYNQLFLTILLSAKFN